MFFSSILREVIRNKTNLFYEILEEIIKEKVKNIRNTDLSFGYMYSKPFMCIEIETINGERKHIALQDVFELIMRKETIIYYLIDMKKNCYKDFNKCILINFNLFEDCVCGENPVEQSNIKELIIYDINLKYFQKDDKLGAFIRFLNEPDNPEFLTTKYHDVKNIKIAYEEVKYKLNNYTLMSFDKSIRDRRSIYGQENIREAALSNKLSELRLEYNFDVDELIEIFKEFDDVEQEIKFIEVGYKIAKDYLQTGKTIDEILDMIKIPYHTVCFSQEYIRKSIV